MPENTFIYDTVYEEFREELQFTDDEMSEAIMFWEDRSLFDELCLLYTSDAADES